MCVVSHAFTLNAEADRYLQVQGHCCLHNKCQASYSYIVKETVSKEIKDCVLTLCLYSIWTLLLHKQSYSVPTVFIKFIVFKYCFWKQ